MPRGWLEASFATRVPAEDDLEHGYQWWLHQGRADGRRWIAGFGNGGQRLVIVPDLGLVVAILAGNYNQPDAWTLAVGEILLPALRQGATSSAGPSRHVALALLRDARAAMTNRIASRSTVFLGNVLIYW